MKRFLAGFKYAFDGIVYAVKTQRNMRIHTVFALYVILALIVTKAARNEWCMALVAIALVMGAESVNTAIEKLCDALHPSHSTAIGRVKDVAAGAVLICAIISAVIGGIIFFNAEKISAAVKFASANPTLAGIIILTIPLAIIFIIGRKEKNK